jgi:hypothetical protein
MRWYSEMKAGWYLFSGVSQGFVEFDLVQVGEDVGVSITIFETQEQAEEANRRAAEWVKQNLGCMDQQIDHEKYFIHR